MLLLLLLLQLMFKVPSTSTHAGSQTSTPLIYCHTDDVVIQVASLLSRSIMWLTSRQYACANWQCWRWQFSTIKSNSAAMDRQVF